MDLGLNIAASGMLAEQAVEDQLANDLANASTAGYKRTVSDQSSFGQLLFANSNSGKTIGSIDSGVEIKDAGVDLTQGALQSTGRPLDFAISGSGFFAVRTPNGIQYTRNGQFATNAQGLLVDQFGNEVLSQGGAPIKVGSADSVPATALGLFTLTNAAHLGDNNFSGTRGGRATGTIAQGELEASGVDPIQTMVAMQSALQSYESGQQAIQSISQTMQASASTEGLVSG
jgi:flagellar basal-body rod protein FlgG